MASFQSGRISPDSQDLWEMISILPRYLLAPSELCVESHQVPWICELSGDAAGTYHFQCPQMRSIFFLFNFFFLKSDIQKIILPQKGILNNIHNSIFISSPKILVFFCSILYLLVPQLQHYMGKLKKALQLFVRTYTCTNSNKWCKNFCSLLHNEKFAQTIKFIGFNCHNNLCKFFSSSVRKIQYYLYCLHLVHSGLDANYLNAIENCYFPGILWAM